MLSVKDINKIIYCYWVKFYFSGLLCLWLAMTLRLGKQRYWHLAKLLLRFM